jgi:copper(I)-binding protein
VAGIIEIHEVIDGQMVAMDGGLVIPANGTVELRMGGWHVMLMELNQALNPGDEVDMTLDFSNGETLTFKAPVKAIAMDDEKYGAKDGM